MPNIKLKSSDNIVFDVDEETAKCSVTIKTMLEDMEDLGGGQGDDDEEVWLQVVRGEILEKVLAWAEHHKNDNQDELGKAELSPWDKDFLKVDKQILFELTRAANFLDIKALLDMTCKEVANMVKGKSPKEIRETFDLN